MERDLKNTSKLFIWSDAYIQVQQHRRVYVYTHAHNTMRTKTGG